ncbi:MAG: AMP-binding protein [Gammaproteobacteria bacterium]|nr:AMP-binding protein [Gammaproteobacteria bacterium]MBI5617546.1 AMP-binding protein [Gammaproteobacteria bacterium]
MPELTARESLPAFLQTLDGSRLALEYGAERWRVADLRGAVSAAARGLAGLGIGAGDCVGLWLPNIPAWIVLFFACAELGAIALSVNTRFRSHELADILGRSKCKALVYWPHFKAIDFADILRGVEAEAIAAIEELVVYQEDDAPLENPLPGARLTRYADLKLAGHTYLGAATPDARCVIFTTSGTTKAPKFVCHRQATVVQHARDVVPAFEFDAPGSLVLQALPLCGVFGFTQALAALAAGTPMIVMPVFEAEGAARIVIERGITHCQGVDDMIDRMLAARPEPQPFPTLRYFGYARFNPALEDIVERAEARGVILRGLYGMSEVHALYALQPLELPTAERRKGGGKPVSPRASVRVRDPESGKVLDVGEHGEIELMGPSVMVEYYGDEQATAEAFTDDGYFKTGDLGYLEDDGRFCYITRMGDVLRLAGFLTSPQEIETVLDEHPEVANSQVVGATIDSQPSAVAFVIMESGYTLDEAALQTWCRERLAGYKVPRRIFALAEFPTTLSANGTKIQRAKLRTLAAERV